MTKFVIQVCLYEVRGYGTDQEEPILLKGTIPPGNKGTFETSQEGFERLEELTK